MPPLFWGIISCLLHPNYWLYLIPLIVAVIFGLIIWPGFLPRTIILLYPKDKNKYDDIFSIDNSNIETIYPGNIQTVRFVAMCYVSIIVLLPIMGGVLSCLPYAGPIMGGLYATITYGPLFFAFLFRWLLRCPVCHLALFDIANDVNINTFNLFKNAWFALFSRKLKCCNCKANFILRKVNKDL
jgi:hypothetical protein